jgi:serine/threonine-protein phosphatase 5
MSDSSGASASASAAEPSPHQVEGNAYFSAGRFTAAVDSYSRAIASAPSAALFSNRAAAHLKLESYGSAIEDAEAALRLDPTFVKAYYRRGSAQMALSRLKLAKKDFAAVLSARPSDKDATAKLAECDKAIKRAAFEAAISTEATRPPSEALSPDSLPVAASYAGPVLPRVPAAGAAATAEACAADPDAVNEHGISLGFVRALRTEFLAQRALHKRFAWEMLVRINRLFRSYRSLIRAPFPTGAEFFNVCGDTHGQFYDTCNIFTLTGEPSPTNPFLFNGDFVDRGSFSVENVLLLFAWKLLYPQHVHLMRGNHETVNQNRVYGFEGEVKAKFCGATMDLFTEVFQALPLATVIDDAVFVTHGGLFCTDGVTLADIEKIPRFCEPPETGGLMSDLLWSDPQPFPGRGPSKRGVGMSFGPDITAAFLTANRLELLIRSHEVKDEGYVVEHAGRCVTIFSAPNYCDSVGNKGAVCRLRRGHYSAPTFVSFSEVPHPPVRVMAYSSMASMFGL